MSNTCTTDYRIIVNDKRTFNKLANVFVEGMKAAELQPYNLQSIAKKAGIDSQRLVSWGADVFGLECYKLEDNRFELSVWVDSAWSPYNKVIGGIVDAVAEKGNASVYYCAEECGNGYYATNNPDYIGEFVHGPSNEDPNVDIPVYEYHSLAEWGFGHLEPEKRDAAPQRVEYIDIIHDQKNEASKQRNYLQEHGYINDSKAECVWYKEKTKAPVPDKTFITDEHGGYYAVHANYDSCVEHVSSIEDAVRFADYADSLFGLWYSNNITGKDNFDFSLAWKIACHPDYLEAAISAATKINPTTEREKIKRQIEEEGYCDTEEVYCPNCNSCFDVKWKKEEYIKHMTGEQRKPIKCPSCGKWTMPCNECLCHNININCSECTGVCNKLNDGK